MDGSPPDFLDRWLKRAEESVGLIPIFVGIGGFSIGLYLGGWSLGATMGIGSFAIVGALEFLHVKIRADYRERAKGVTTDPRFFELQKKNRWHIKTIRETDYDGFFFRALGFEEAQIPFEVTQPLCPKCREPLAERTTVLFPCVIRVRYKCLCGFSRLSTRTKADLMDEVRQLLNVPRKAS